MSKWFKKFTMYDEQQVITTSDKTTPLPHLNNFCGWCGNKLCDSQQFNNTCFNCGKSPYSNHSDKKTKK